MRLKLLSLTVLPLVALIHLDAQPVGWEPATGHKQLPIWPGDAPNSRPVTGPETVVTENVLIAGKPYTAVSRVTQPTITVYSPTVKNTGVAVIVFPGGGYTELAIDLEGTEICDWQTSKGITAVLLKYRVPGPDFYSDSKYRKSGPYPKTPLALQDAQRAIRIVRARAADWAIDPKKIGVIGFSAGGHLVAATSTLFDRQLYPTMDAFDEKSCRPDFAIAIYPGHLWNWTYIDNPPFELNPSVPVTAATSPTFLLQAEDDPVDDVNHSLVYYIALKKAGVPVEMHLYAQGGHAFGLRPTKFPITKWPRLVETWLSTIGMTPE